MLKTGPEERLIRSSLARLIHLRALERAAMENEQSAKLTGVRLMPGTLMAHGLIRKRLHDEEITYKSLLKAQANASKRREAQ